MVICLTLIGQSQRIQVVIVSCSMSQHVKINQKSNEQYAEALWRCEECGLQDTNSHLLWCTGYESLRGGKDLECDQHLCDNLQKIFILRTEKLLD